MKIKTLFRLLTIAALVLFVIPSCVKEGPAGMDGVNGADGTDGADGADGADGTAFCMTCHTESVVTTISSEWGGSLHALGTSFAYAGGRKDCSRCHSGDGFITYIETAAADTTTSTKPITCEACHSHGSSDIPSFQDDDGNPVFVRTTEPVSLIIDMGKTIDFGNESNLCVNCHQPRTAYPVPDTDGNFTITNSHYGPHHGPQSTVLMGLGMYAFSGSATIPGEGAHTHSTVGCVTCHMDMDEGKHTFGEPYLDACTQCHGDVTDADINDKQTEVLSLMTRLHDLLDAKGVFDAVENSEETAAVMPVNDARAYYNYLTVEEDRSEGAHNADYVIAILTNTIETLEQ